MFGGALFMPAPLGKQGELSVERATPDSLKILGINLSDRLRDIPIPDVMEKMGYCREQQGNDFVYRDAQQRVTLAVNEKNKLGDDSRVICWNSLDAMLHLRNVNEGKNISSTDALHWLAESFGSSRALAAVVVSQEQHSAEHLREWSLENARAGIDRDQLQKITVPGREPTLGREMPAERTPELQVQEWNIDLGYRR